MRKFTWIALILTIPILSGCKSLKEIKTFAKCDFRMVSLTNPKIAGVGITGKNSFKDLNFLDGAKLTKSLLSGRLPLNFTLNVEAKNPNPTTAAMNSMEWIAFIDGVEIARGNNQQRVEIPSNGGKSTIPLNISTDLKSLLAQKSRDAILNFGFNLADAGNRPTRVTLKVKPTISVAGIPLSYPGFISVNREFGN